MNRFLPSPKQACSQSILGILLLIGYVWRASLSNLDTYLERGTKLQRTRPGSQRPIIKMVNLLFVCHESRREVIKDNTIRDLFLDTAKRVLVNKREELGLQNVTVYASDVQATAPPTAYDFFPIIKDYLCGDIRFGPVHVDEETGGISLVSSPSSSANVVTTQVGQVIKEFQNLPGIKHVYAYLVESSLYTDYGEYGGPARSGWDPTIKRTWGARASPYVVTHSLLVIPSWYQGSRTSWKTLYSSTQGQVSEIQQPRAKYVRNFVVEAIASPSSLGSSPGPPDIAAIVVEVWPSPKHITSLFYFLNAADIVELLVEVATLLRSLGKFINWYEVQGNVYTEYVLL